MPSNSKLISLIPNANTLSFKTGTTPTERMRIQSDGTVNILGNTKIGGAAGDTPASTVEVDGTVSVTGDIDFSGELQLSGSAGTNGYVLTSQGSGSSPVWAVASGGGVDTSGTPANNQIAVFTDADTIEGDSNFTWDGDAQLLTVTGRRYTVTSNTVNKPAASTDFYRDQYEWSLSQGSPNLTSSPNFYQQYIKGTIGLTNAGSGSNALNYSNIYNTVTFNSAGSGSTARINNIYSLYNYLTLSAQVGEIVDSARTVYNRLYISDDVKGDNNGTFDAYVVENRVDTLNNSLGKIGNLIGEKVFFNITNSGSSITTAKSYEARFSSSATIANGYLFDGYYVGTLPTNAYGFRFYNASNAGNGDLTSIHDGDIEPYTTLAGNLGSATTYWGGIYVDNVFISGEVSANSSVGTAGQILTSAGSGANAYWSTPSGVDTSGTPANNQIAVFTDADTIEGDSNFTWDGTKLSITGNIESSGNVLPSANNTYNIGDASSKWWNNLYIDGIYFKQSYDGGQTGSEDRLEWFERGSWTPSYYGTTTSPSATYQNQNGAYYRIGDFVHCWFFIATSNVTSVGSGELEISGLPYTVFSSQYSEGTVHYSTNFSTSTNNYPHSMLALGSTTRAKLYSRIIDTTTSRVTFSSFNSCNDLKSGPVTNGNYMYGSISYYVTA